MGSHGRAAETGGLILSGSMFAVVAGVALLVIAVLIFIGDKRAQRAHETWCASAAKTTGVISRVGVRNHLSRNKPTGTEDGVSAVAVVKFKAANGVEYEFDAPRIQPKPGTEIAVAYDPAVPSTARVLDRPRNAGCASIFAVAGIALLIWGIVTMPSTQ